MRRWRVSRKSIVAVVVGHGLISSCILIYMTLYPLRRPNFIPHVPGEYTYTIIYLHYNQGSDICYECFSIIVNRSLTGGTKFLQKIHLGLSLNDL
ncbi:unnamed protein product [Aphis gossypii]|uniref:Uncharacterized protein n=1 Tax=Aphis gossypii TaxID=80765 RepID=A0A9P0JF74_APHGO|nr:unnamed protein product [Aphis gossypii]